MILPRAVIFDLDGTVCDDSHRQTILLNNKGNITDDIWRQYHSACVDDAPIDIVCRCLYLLSLDNEIIIITGRDEQYRQITLDWLLKHNLPHDELYMRPNGHHVSSVEFKRNIYNEQIKDKFDIVGVFEDRKCVTDMWREEGLICLQTKEGNY